MFLVLPHTMPAWRFLRAHFVPNKHGSMQCASPRLLMSWWKAAITILDRKLIALRAGCDVAAS